MWPHIWRRLEASYIYLSLANIIFEYTHTHTHTHTCCLHAKKYFSAHMQWNVTQTWPPLLFFAAPMLLIIFCYPIVKSCPTLVTPWTVARPVFLSSTIFWSFIKLMTQWSMMPSNHLILCHPLSFCPPSFPPSGSFPMSQVFTSGGQSIGASVSASAFPMNIQGRFPLGLTNLISLQSKL